MAVKNYSIRRVAEYRVVESDPHNDVNRSFVMNREVRRFGGPHECLAPSMSSDHAQLDGRLICSAILHIVKANPFVRVPVLQAAMQQSYGFTPTYRKV
ncbi:hypothetical protein PIB30_059511 [Stylosanthes scabra]|uniref:Uncharacterized protein n=1 Tax=Stylosanthes scabra TaxID=79078 RepID=A0ABU6ZIY2_9FABA|nr:hypothetical protein [Stylosanthes scabra]